MLECLNRWCPKYLKINIKDRAFEKKKNEKKIVIVLKIERYVVIYYPSLHTLIPFQVYLTVLFTNQQNATNNTSRDHHSQTSDVKSLLLSLLVIYLRILSHYR